MYDTQKPLNRLKELLQTARHASMATVNDDATPHNTPFLFLHDQDMTKIYWGSHPESQHSRNILRTGQLFVVVYDAVKRGGLYIKADEGHIATGDEFDEALEAHNQFRATENKMAIHKDYYVDQSPQRMWSATIITMWMNNAERDEHDRLIKDYRQEVTAQQLLG